MNVISKQTTVLLGLFAMVAVVTLAPHAFAQSTTGPVATSGGAQYSLGTGGIQEPSTAGSDPTPAYATGIVVIGVMTGVGIWSAASQALGK